MGNQYIDKTVGILGGMGPEATIDLMQRIIRLTPAKDDIDHIRCLVDNNPKIPSRIKALIDGDGEDPGPYLVKMAVGLQQSGADFLAIACNTAHYYYEEVSKAVKIPIIHIVDAVLALIQLNYPDCKKIGILASPALQITKLYEQKFSQAGITIVYPNAEDQALLFKVIKAVKAGDLGDESQQCYTRICDNFAAQAIPLAIIACTELSVLKHCSSLQTVDAADILAKQIIQLAKC